ncbi:MAG TPA: tetratricopeptide repeat protein [Elusimicrobiota bacterium]|nr:tetratricopeptide repeat protein [Elusimicrobiota bacterium]
MRNSDLERRTLRLLPFLVALTAVAAFSPALRGGFLQWDDVPTLVDNASWRGLTPSHLKWMLTTFHMGPWQPLSWLSFALDLSFWGMNPFGFHLTNLILHGAAAGLCVLLFEELLRAGAPRSAEAERSWAAAFGALVFAIHPLRVESACWITERRDVLSGCLYVLALLLYMRRARGKGGLRPVFAAFAAACLAKGSAITLPIALLILDAWPLRRRALTEKLPFLAVSLAVGLIGVAGQRSYGALKTLDQSGLGERFALSAYGLWFDAAKTLWPSGLAPYYPVPAGFGPGSIQALAAFASLLAVAAAAWSLRRRAPAVPAALLYCAAAAAPALGAVRFGAQLTADHFFYLSGIGWGALASAVFLASPRGRLRALGASAGVLALGLTSFSLSFLWRGDLTLWTRGVSAYPDAYVPDVNMAHALRAAGREDEAADYERRAIAADPLNADMRNNYGSWLLSKGRVPEALEQLRRAAELSPASAPIRFNLGMALRAGGQRKEGLDALAEAVALDPGYGEALNNLGLALLEDGRAEDAARRFEEADKASPRWAVPRYNLGNALTALGREAEASRAYREAVELDSGLEPAWVNLGNAAARAGDLRGAAASYERALTLAPGDAAARNNLEQVRLALSASR